MPSVYARAVRRAAEIAGGMIQLSAAWHVPIEELMKWLEGTRPVPQEFFLRAVDIITEYDVEELNHPAEDFTVVVSKCEVTDLH